MLVHLVTILVIQVLRNTINFSFPKMYAFLTLTSYCCMASS